MWMTCFALAGWCRPGNATPVGAVAAINRPSRARRSATAIAPMPRKAWRKKSRRVIAELFWACVMIITLRGRSSVQEQELVGVEQDEAELLQAQLANERTRQPRLIVRRR